jgi:hypothetical protein
MADRRTGGSDRLLAAVRLSLVVLLDSRSAGARRQSSKGWQGGRRLPAGRQFGQQLGCRLEHLADRSLEGLFGAG